MDSFFIESSHFANAKCSWEQKKKDSKIRSFLEFSVKTFGIDLKLVGIIFNTWLSKFLQQIKLAQKNEQCFAYEHKKRAYEGRFKKNEHKIADFTDWFGADYID